MRARIMVIEDDLDTQFLFSEILESEGYRVISKSNGRDALNFLYHNPVPDLIFMDLLFPGGSPEDFTEKLRQIPGALNTPVVLVSAKADIAEYAIRLGARDFLKKPFEIEPLLRVIHQTI